MGSVIVSTKELMKKFGSFVAVDSVTFEVERGEIYGFLGANGAGKTTTIKMLCGLLEPTSGDALVAGYSIGKDPDEVKKRLGYMSQKFSLYSNLTVRENMTFFAGIYGMDSRSIKARIGELIREIELGDYADRLVSVLPGGLKQRVALGCAYIHRPELIFLDEPTAGVDPLLRRKFWGIIDSLSSSGITVFVTTHYMDEVEHCHRVALMDSGRIIKEGTIEEIKSATFSYPVLEVETPDAVHSLGRLLAKKASIGEISLHGAMLHVIPRSDINTARKNLLFALEENNIAHGKISEIEPSMEDVFVKLIKK